MNKKLLAVPICALVLVGGTIITAKARESNAAADVFTQSELSAEGLSREDLKAVYRDITTNRFANDKTVEVIRRSVPGVEILREDPTPDELAALCSSSVDCSSVSSTKNAVEYRQEYVYQPGAEYYEFDKIIVECLRGGETLWKADFPTLGKKWEDDEFYVRDGVMTSAGSAVWGEITHWMIANDHSKSHPHICSWVARIDDSGNKLWQVKLDHGFEDEYIGAVLDNGDDTWAVISRGDYEYLCLSQFDINGNEISCKKTKIGSRGLIGNAARLGDGYLVQLRDDSAGIIKLDRNGNVIDNFVYESDDCNYYITDMAEFEGNVYLSAYSVPKSSDGYRDGVFGILEQIITDKGTLDSYAVDPYPLDLTSEIRAHYTAVLLLCEPNGGEPKKFYSAKSSLGGVLVVENDRLRWNVENIIQVGYIPYVNSFPIGGRSLVYRYSFDENGAIIGCEDTGKAVSFLW